VSLPERAVLRPVTTVMVFVAVIALGAISLSRLAIDLLPEIDFPSVSVFTSYEGVGPEEMETLVTRPIEEAVATVQGVERIESFSAEGRSRTALRFAWGTSLETAVNDVRAAVERIRAVLPEDAGTPTVFKFDLSSFPIMMLTLSGDLPQWRLRHLAEDTLKYRLERVEGVAGVSVRGGLRREIHVDLDADRLSSLGVTAGQVADALRRDNVNLPAGDVREHGVEVIVRTLGEFSDLSRVGAVVVTVRDGLPLRVRDLAAVQDSWEDPTSAVRIDGRSGVRLSVSKLPGANTVTVARRVRRAVARLDRELAHVTLGVRFDTAEYIEDAIDNVQRSVLLGAGLAIMVLLLFLRSVRATLIVGVAIPIAVVGTFALMYLGGFTLNLVTFGGLALGIGMLVDSAIVILENISRHREAGVAARQAAVRGSREVATAIIASTLTTLCVFVPVVFISGFASIFFGQMAAVVSFALLCALAVALTLIPVLASRGGGAEREEDRPALARAVGRGLTRIEDGYAALLRVALRRRWLVYLLALGLLGGSVAAVPLVGFELMPEGDQGEIRVRAELPVGTPLERSLAVVAEAEAAIRKAAPEVVTVMSLAGPPGFWSNAGSNALSLRLALVPRAERVRCADDVAAAVRAALRSIPGLDARVRAGERFWLFRMLRGGGERLVVDVRGYDLEVGARLARQVADLLKATPGVTFTDVDRKEGSREAVVRVDVERAADQGLSVGYVAETVSTYVLGRRATVFREGGDEFGVRVRLREADRHALGQLEGLPLLTPSGTRVTLGDVATVARREGPVAVRRLNQQRIVGVSAGLSGRDLGSVTADVRAALAGLAVPDGFSVTLGGEVKEQEKTQGQMLAGLLLALALVYMVMASLFESLVHPFVMLLSIPFAVVGVVGTLLATGTTLNVNSMLGVIVLVGVVVNNAIVLVDYVNLQRRERGLPLAEAVVEGARRRLRPILMTTLTTSLALLPVAMGAGEGGELQAPLARVVVGGLLSSTLVTLVLVPALYTTVESLRSRSTAAS